MSNTYYCHQRLYVITGWLLFSHVCYYYAINTTPPLRRVSYKRNASAYAACCLLFIFAIRHYIFTTPIIAVRLPLMSAAPLILFLQLNRRHRQHQRQ